MLPSQYEREVGFKPNSFTLQSIHKMCVLQRLGMMDEVVNRSAREKELIRHSPSFTTSF